ncbi:MAG: hypothetical protein R3304_10200 [Longimicrobiales bacterium]|nr:hypothetical protein [Longimicrobiales bacterium]
MMRSTFDRVTRRQVAISVAVAYAVPLFLGLGASALHAGEHVAQILTGEKERLTALGLVHGFGGDATSQDTSARVHFRGGAMEEAATPHGYVHEHGGMPHSHGGMVGEALDADWTDDGEQPEASFASGLASHLPTADQAAILPPCPLLDPADAAAQPKITAAPLPPLRPPRA